MAHSPKLWSHGKGEGSRLGSIRRLAIAHHRPDGGRRPDRGERAAPRTGRGLLAGTPAVRGRPLRAGAGYRRRQDPRRDATRYERPHPGPRIWRRRLPGEGRDGLLLELRGPTPLPVGRGRSTPPDHAGASRAGCPPLCRRQADTRRAMVRLRSRAARGRRTRERARRHPGGWFGRAADRRRRPRLLLESPALARRAANGVAVVGSPADALGRQRAVGGRALRRWDPRGAEAGGGRSGGVDLPAGLESRGHPALRLRPHGVVEPLPGGRRPRGGPRSAGGGVRGPCLAVRHVDVCVPPGWPDRLPPWIRPRDAAGSRGRHPSLHRRSHGEPGAVGGRRGGFGDGDRPQHRRQPDGCPLHDRRARRAAFGR